MEVLDINILLWEYQQLFSDTKYSRFQFYFSSGNQNEYFDLLKKIDKIPKPSKTMIKNAQIYWLTNLNILYNSHNILPKSNNMVFLRKIVFKKISQVKILDIKRIRFLKIF